MIQPAAYHSFAITLFPTPVFNTPDIASCFGGENGDTLFLDEQGMMRSVETILFSGTLIKLLEKMEQPHIWKIETKEYPYNVEQFVDERFITKLDAPPAERAEASFRCSHFENTVGIAKNALHLGRKLASRN